MNKQLIEVMAQALINSGATINPNTNHYWAAERVFNAVHDAGFVVVPKEPTEAMLNASGCECGMGAPEGYGDPNELYITNDYKAMIQSAQEEISHVEKSCATCKHEQHVHCNSATDCVNNSLWEGK